MGYYSDVRAILKKEDFEALKKVIEESPYDNLKNMDILEIRGKNKDYVYFGWNGIKWYFGPEFVQTIITSCEEHQFVRIGEDYEDIEEHYNLEEYDGDSIGVIRYFEGED